MIPKESGTYLVTNGRSINVLVRLQGVFPALHVDIAYDLNEFMHLGQPRPMNSTERTLIEINLCNFQSLPVLTEVESYCVENEWSKNKPAVIFTDEENDYFLDIFKASYKANESKSKTIQLAQTVLKCTRKEAEYLYEECIRRINK